MVLSAIQERRSVREFSSREVPEELVQALIRAAQFAPTGMNNRAVEFVVLRDPAAKNRLFDLIEPKQPFVKEAPLLILPVTDRRQVPLPGLDQTVVAVADLAIASSFLMIQAAALGLGSVWKHITSDTAPAVVLAFGLPSEFTLTNVLAIGYARKPLPPHQDSEFLPAKIHRERW